MVFISVWLKLVVNKYFAVYQRAHAWQIENLAETNFGENFGRAQQILSVQCARTLKLDYQLLTLLPRTHGWTHEDSFVSLSQSVNRQQIFVNVAWDGGL